MNECRVKIDKKKKKKEKEREKKIMSEKKEGNRTRRDQRDETIKIRIYKTTGFAVHRLIGVWFASALC